MYYINTFILFIFSKIWEIFVFARGGIWHREDFNEDIFNFDQQQYQGLKITYKQLITIKTKTSAVSSSKPGGGSGEAGSAGTSALGPGVK